MTWTLTNTSNAELIVPNDVRLQGLFATMTVTNDRGTERPVRPFVIECETVRLEPLAPGGQLTASYRLFWSTAGFALDRPGRHLVTVTVAWSVGGVPVGVTDDVELWVDHPTSDAENRDAALAMNPEVGKWVALGGGAYHLTEAVDRLSALASGDAAAADPGRDGRRRAGTVASRRSVRRPPARPRRRRHRLDSQAQPAQDSQEVVHQQEAPSIGPSAEEVEALAADHDGRQHDQQDDRDRVQIASAARSPVPSEWERTCPSHHHNSEHWAVNR